MEQIIIQYLQKLSDNPKFITFILSMLPVGELRGSIPWAFLFTDLKITTIVSISLLGNFLITIPIIFLFEPVVKILSQWYYFDIFFKWLINRTRKRAKLVKRYSMIGIILFVGIPLPVTGAWTGCVASYLFGVPKHKALVSIFLGLCMSATIVTLLLISGKWFFNA